MSTTVEQIKQRLSIVDVIESYIKLDRAGTNLKGKCPFHNEKTPSFFVSSERGSFYCFGCGAKGDIFEFVEKFEGLDFMGALKTLAARAGVEIVHENPKAKSEKDRLYSAMEDACKYFESLLNLYPEARNYLSARGLKDETIKAFRVGFVPEEWRKLYSHLNSKGYSDNDIEKVGLTKKVEKPTHTGTGGGYYDRFRGRIMFPIMDSGGRVIAFSGRILVDDGKSAKYLNSPDTVLFNKSNVLYGIDKAKIHIRRMGFTTLVEGQMDLIMSHQAGYNNTVAVSGTALTDSLVSREDVINNLGIVRRLSSNMILAFDSDKAGFNAAGRAAQIGLSLGMDIKIASVPKGKDPADFILENPTGWKEVLKDAKHVVDFHIDQALKESNDPRKIAKNVKEKVLSYVAALGSHMERAHFVSKIRERTGIAESAIMEDLKKVIATIAMTQTTSAPVTKENTTEKAKDRDSIEQKILGIILWQDSQEKPKINTSEFKEQLKVLMNSEVEITDVEKTELIFKAEVFYANSKTDLKKDFIELLRNLEEEQIKQNFSLTMKALADAERKKDESLATELLLKCQELGKKLNALKAR